MATSPYLAGQRQRYRVTLELEVLEDFDPHQIDWNKVLDLQGKEKASAYVEDLSCPDCLSKVSESPHSTIEWGDF
jgi:hypothetical protein